MRSIGVLFALAAALISSGCETMGSRETGAAIGAAAGGMLGRSAVAPRDRTTGTLLGAAAGAGLGYVIGGAVEGGRRTEGSAEQAGDPLNEVLLSALNAPSGRASSQWSAGGTSYSSTVVARPDRAPQGYAEQQCKRFEQQTLVRMLGSTQRKTRAGLACVTPEGKWALREMTQQ
jgi:hypothetical protein